MPKVQYRGSFSDRNNIEKLNTTIQINDLDNRTRIVLINYIRNRLTSYQFYLNEEDNFICKLIQDAFNQEHAFTGYESHYKEKYYSNYINKTITDESYGDIFSLLEYIANYSYDGKKYHIIKAKDINNIFEKEFVGYRFVSNLITPITEKIEIEEIEQSITKNPFDNCKYLITEALEKLSNRENPDYTGSIHKSISAVESICQTIAGKQGTLDSALKIIKKKGILEIDGALENSFSSMFGWTSNNGNIRHANAFKSKTPTFDDAKFMLVTCSAFVNYLISNYSKLTIKN